MMILFFSQSPVFAVAEPPEIKAPLKNAESTEHQYHCQQEGGFC